MNTKTNCAKCNRVREERDMIYTMGKWICATVCKELHEEAAKEKS